jgi:hypothetical protein
VEVDGEQEWEVEDILDSRWRYQKLQYLIKWKGYDDPSWEDARMVNRLEAIDLFHDRYPDKPGPLPEDEE